MLCLLPIAEGRARIPAQRPVTFELRDGHVELKITQDRNLSIVLLAAGQRMEDASARLTQLLTLST